MSLHHCQGSILTKYDRDRIINPHQGVEVDFYFMAKRFAQSKTEISLRLWTVIIDHEGFRYCMVSAHVGHFEFWREVISNRIEQHLYKVGVDGLQTKRILRDIEIKKEGHIIRDNPYGSVGTRVGIDGTDEIYVRKDKFNFIT